MFFCDPFGHTQPENLLNYGSDTVSENDYVFFHDQEPIQIQAHKLLFEKVVRSNQDLGYPPGHVIVSERGQCLTQLCDIYGWQPHYYFFHGWACLDWFRGYNRSFLFEPPTVDRRPSKTFMSPNRIIGGQRDHRVLFLYHCARLGLLHNHISAPALCPAENVTIDQVAASYVSRYPDIQQVVRQIPLPRCFQGETQQLMTSCWLGNFEEAQDSLVYVPTETVYTGSRQHLTEKTFKAIALGMPFIMVAPAHSLEYLRSYGFRTFHSIWDESYDQENDDFLRLEKVAQLLHDIDNLSLHERHVLAHYAKEICVHNWNHFYHGTFENTLMQELELMLDCLRI